MTSLRVCMTEKLGGKMGRMGWESHEREKTQENFTLGP